MFIELIIILGVTYLGVIFKEILRIPLPATIVAMGIMFFLVYKRYLPLERIEKTSNFLLGNMTILFIPATVKIYEYLSVLKTEFFKLIILLIVTTVVTMMVTAKVVHILIERKKGE